MSMLMDIMGGVISGAAFGGDVRNQFLDYDQPQNVGHFFMAMKPDLFVSKDEYLKRMDTLVQRVHALPTARRLRRDHHAGRDASAGSKRRAAAPECRITPRKSPRCRRKRPRPACRRCRSPTRHWCRHMKINDYDLDIVVQGFPGKSVCHGGLGWSTVVLLRAHGRIVLVDTGDFSMRTMLLKRFAERGLKPADVTDLLLTHSHHDHSVNWPMFPNARIVIGAHELDWSLTVPWGETPVPEFYMRELKTCPTLHKAAEGEEVFPGITAHLAPGHTPGCLVYVLHAPERDVIFAGDAAKNRAELVSGTTDMTYDAAVSKASIE